VLLKVLDVNPERKRVALSMRQVPLERQIAWAMDNVDTDEEVEEARQPHERPVKAPAAEHLPESEPVEPVEMSAEAEGDAIPVEAGGSADEAFAAVFPVEAAAEAPETVDTPEEPTPTALAEIFPAEPAEESAAPPQMDQAVEPDEPASPPAASEEA
jgi:hypothetical protein